LPSGSHGLRRTIDQATTKLKVDLDIQYELDTLTLMKAVALAGIAHTILAMPAVADEVDSGALTATQLDTPSMETRLMIATSLNRALTHAGRAVLQQIRPVLQQSIESAVIPLHMRLD